LIPRLRLPYRAERRNNIFFFPYLIFFWGGARNQKMREENFVEALPPLCGGAESSVISGFASWICGLGLAK